SACICEIRLLLPGPRRHGLYLEAALFYPRMQNLAPLRVRPGSVMRPRSSSGVVQEDGSGNPRCYRSPRGTEGVCHEIDAVRETHPVRENDDETSVDPCNCTGLRCARYVGFRP